MRRWFLFLAAASLYGAPPSFRNQVIPVFTKIGCNSGACHGAAAGKNGFHLTLRGYDIAADYIAITRQSGGRRVVMTEPGRSLLLLKPSMAVAHAGGLRLPPGSPEYRVVADWISAGAPAPTEADPFIQEIEIQPRQAKSGPLAVTAHFSDGSSADVTRWARFATVNEAVAAVDENGRVEVRGAGEAAITAAFLGKVAVARVTVPAANRVDAAAFDNAPRRNFIDDAILKKLAELRIPPSQEAGDGEFLRRAYLDAAGILPSVEETRAFLADRRADKRAAVIESLLSRPEFTDYWTYKWADLLSVNRDTLSLRGMLAFYKWLRDGVESDKPWNQVAREILTASGNSFENGPVNYYRLHRTPEELTETTLQAFMGMRIMCARCHNHPFEKWTQTDYYGVASFFPRVNYKDGGQPGDLSVIPAARGEIDHPRLGRPVAPQPLDGKPLDPEATADRRRALADWIVSPDNPYFARSFVNRVWANFVGRGLIEPVDDLRATNPASNEELLASLTADFVQHNFSLRHLARTIMNSAAYQRSSRTLPENEKDGVFYSHYILKRLPAEVILDAMSAVTGSAEQFSGMPAGTRALELPDTKVTSQFLDIFGRPKRVITGESERRQEPSITQALQVLNGSTLNQKVSAPGGMVDALVTASTPLDQALERMYLAALSRFPTEREKQALLAVLDSGGAPADNRKRDVLEDILWSLLSGKEFLFNH